MTSPPPPDRAARRRRFLRSLAGLCLAALLLLAPAAPLAAATRVQWAEGPAPDGAAGFRRALAAPRWRFPADHGPHPDYQTEWWYYTGNLETAEGRPFGFEFTLFRQALAPATATTATDPPASAWRTPQLYSAHFSVSDIAAGRFQHDERFARGSLGLAGAAADPYRIWLNDWQVEALDPAASRVRLQAATAAMAIDLELRATRPPLLQGEAGLSRKGPEPGNASLYYSQIQQATQGSVRLGEEVHAVQGVAWMDHEIFTNSLSPGTVGWDWFSAQFDDGSALMLYDLRHEGGGREPESAGRWIPPGRSDGELLSADDLELTVTRRWRSPHTGASYPAGWRLRLPRLDLELMVEPLLADQELVTASATYWEGAVRYRGHRGEQPLNGRGYVELTGYADRIDERLGARRSPRDQGE